MLYSAFQARISQQGEAEAPCQPARLQKKIHHLRLSLLSLWPPIRSTCKPHTAWWQHPPTTKALHPTTCSSRAASPICCLSHRHPLPPLTTSTLLQTTHGQLRPPS